MTTETSYIYVYLFNIYLTPNALSLNMAANKIKLIQ